MEVRKLIVLLFMGLFLVTVFSVGNVIADSDNSNSGRGNSGDDDDKKSIFRYDGKDVKFRIEIERDNGITRRKVKFERKGGESEVETDLEIEVEEEDGERKLKARLSNGNRQLIKILPEEMLDIAAEELGSDDVEVELEESVHDGVLRVVYNVKTNKNGRFLGIFRMKVRVEGQIDSETGEFFGKRKPWWAFLVFGEDEFELGDRVSVCHVPPGNPNNAHTITIGSPAVRAHLRHGDSIGACGGDDDGNMTDPGNETMKDLTLSILSPEPIKYDIGMILVDIDSNGDFVSFTINNGSAINYTAPVLMTFIEGANLLEAFASDSDGELSVSVEFTVILGNVTDPGNMTDTGNETDNNNTVNVNITINSSGA